MSVNNPERTDIIEKIFSFLREIGIEVNFETLDEPTFLPGIEIHYGTLAVDDAKLKYPGDLLHEAGHLAVVSPARRKKLHKDAGQKAGEEMTAIAWSYAAAMHIGIEPSVLFHADGYRGDGEWLIENFSNGNYFAVCTLQWLGMTIEPKDDLPAEIQTYPKMLKWTLDNEIKF